MPKGRDKEKPLLTVQGILRLDKSFVTAKNDDAQTIQVRKNDEAEPEEIKLVPGQSEHEMVAYKAGYAVGPANPHPENEQEAEIMDAHSKVQERQEEFERMAEQSAQERKAREREFMKKGFVLEPKTVMLEKQKQKEEEEKQKPWDPTDPSNYQLPPGLMDDDDDGPERSKRAALPPGLMDDNDGPPRSAGPSYGAGPLLPPGDDDAAMQEEDAAMSRPAEASMTVAVEEDAADGNGYDPNSLEGQERRTAADEDLPRMMPMPTPEEAPRRAVDMAMEVAQQMEEKRKQRALQKLKESEERGEEITEEDIEDIRDVYSLDELQAMQESGELAGLQGTSAAAHPAQQQAEGPSLPNADERDALLKEQRDLNNKQVLDSYWQFVRENPQDFNGWCHLVDHVENMNDLDEVRAVYNAFLPLYPYCYAYWERYSDLERKHENWQRSLAILHRGLEAIPLSVDLWLNYLDLYYKMYCEHDDFEDLFRVQCERAVQTVGLEYRSDALWERYIEWEAACKNLKRVTDVYRRLVAVPTKLYNKHWDNFIAHIRDNHPRDILEYESYEELRKLTCQELDLKYRPDPVMAGSKKREVVQPEDKLKAGMKERIVASVVEDHERCGKLVEKRYKLEKIKRTYFHVTPVDLKDLKNWEAYLDLEIAEGDHERIVVLFERCLIPCAQYEHFWIKYARYLEAYHKECEKKAKKAKKAGKGDADDADKATLKKAKWAFGTGLGTVEDMREKRCTWTLRGWKDKDKDGKEVMRAEEVEVPAKKAKMDEGAVKDKEEQEEAAQEKAEKEKEEKAAEEKHMNMIGPVVDAPAVADAATESTEESSSGAKEQSTVDSEMSGVLKTSYDGSGRQAVRDVYHRACVVHCPKRVLVKLAWAAFEEDGGDLDKAKEILTGLREHYPLLLECRLQLIDLYRREGAHDKVEEEYKALLKKIPKNRANIRTWVSIKLARCQFKVRGQADKALATLRTALKKDRSDPKLYSQIIDVCYQRHPVDVAGVTASIELAIKSPDLNNMQKYEFVKRKLEFMQEFGDVDKYREARDQIAEYKKVCAEELKAEARKKEELEEQEEKLKELESLKAQVRADANAKAKIAEMEGRLLCTHCQSAMYPDAGGNYEFEGFQPGVHNMPMAARRAEPSADVAMPADAGDDEDGGVVDLMDMVIPEHQEAQIKKTLEEKTKYKEVAPTWELNMESYGYGKNKKAYDPDYEHIENSRFKEYERLEGEGYDEAIKDPDHAKLRNLKAPGLGSVDPDTGKRVQGDAPRERLTASDYIVPPKVPQMLVPGKATRMEMAAAEEDESKNQMADHSAFELPKEIANVTESPCVNVPEWFVKEGGELCLSDTGNGKAMLRYWPKFLSDKGNQMMFNKLRRYCKWHQKQIKIGGEWKYETRLVSTGNNKNGKKAFPSGCMCVW